MEDLLIIKLLLNSIISTKEACFIMVDIKNFYLNTSLKRYKYLKLKMEKIPDDVIEQYKLKQKATSKGLIYGEVKKGIYGFPQVGWLVQELRN